jgi:ABC-type phosphate/phosphonate transport system substrate-binding protein
MLVRRLLALALLTLAFAAGTVSAADFVVAITEGVTYQATPKEIRERFAPLTELIGRALHRNVRTVIVPAYDDLRTGLGTQEFDLAFVHPAHVALVETKAGRYKAIAWTAGYTDYTVSLMTPASEPLKGVSDLRGHTLVTPDPDSITAVMVRAMFREQKLTPKEVKVITTRYQDAVPFYLEHGFAQVGATAARSVVKSWTDKGGRVVAQSRAVPIKQWIVSSRVSAADQERIRDVLLNLADIKGGKPALAALGYKGFVPPTPEVEAVTVAWLGL